MVGVRLHATARRGSTNRHRVGSRKPATKAASTDPDGEPPRHRRTPAGDVQRAAPWELVARCTDAPYELAARRPRPRRFAPAGSAAVGPRVFACRVRSASSLALPRRMYPAPGCCRRSSPLNPLIGCSCVNSRVRARKSQRTTLPPGQTNRRIACSAAAPSSRCISHDRAGYEPPPEQVASRFGSSPGVVDQRRPRPRPSACSTSGRSSSTSSGAQTSRIAAIGWPSGMSSSRRDRVTAP